MDEKIAKLETATAEAALQLGVARQALETAEADLARAKEKYRALSAQLEKSGDSMLVTDTELPELLETRIRAKNVLETIEAKHKTNQRYLDMMIRKRDSANSGEET
ncbi:unnamed protein product [Pseudo-nitzschia multistriata]|uniref:Uncharacterized protein n=1 Tax=Pseudo-nitzschia multistriata TaxID=183589 RepID=A0A448ZS17_9STRA|nr:unnamed protein product [Pseudo-nitzschia multistriata]